MTPSVYFNAMGGLKYSISINQGFIMTLIGYFNAMGGLKYPISINQGFTMTLIGYFNTMGGLKMSHIYQSGVHDDPDGLF